MSIPVSKGIGTGAAQVFNQDKTYQALQGMAGRKMQLDDYNKKLEEQRRKENLERQKKRVEAGQKQFDLLNYDATKLRANDIEYIRDLHDDLTQKYNGRWEDISYGGAEAMQFKNDLGKFKDVIAQSVITKTKENELYSELFNEDTRDRYTEEQRQEFLDTLDKSGIVYDRDYAGKFTPQRQFEEPLKLIQPLFKDMGAFIKPVYSIQTDTGKTAQTGTEWQDNFEAWKNVVSTSTKALASINNLYGEDDNEKMKKMYEAWKESVMPKQSSETVETTKEEEEDKSIGGGYDSKKWRAVFSYNKETGRNSVAFAPVSTSDSPLQLSGEEIVVNGKAQAGFGNVFDIWEEDGKLRATIAMEDDEGNKVNKEVTLGDDAVKRIRAIVGMSGALSKFIQSQTPEVEYSKEELKYEEALKKLKEGSRYKKLDEEYKKLAEDKLKSKYDDELNPDK